MEKHPKFGRNLVLQPRKYFCGCKKLLMWYIPQIWYIRYIYITRILYQPLISSWIIPVNSGGLRQSCVGCRKCPNFTALLFDMWVILCPSIHKAPSTNILRKTANVSTLNGFCVQVFVSPFYIYKQIWKSIININNY